jgi:nitroreductase
MDVGSELQMTTRADAMTAGDAAAVLRAIAGRASAVRLKDPGPDDDQLMAILSAGVRAPDHGRLTPWRFVVIEGRARAAFGMAMAQSCARENPGFDERRLLAEAEKPLRAPLIIAVAARVVDHDKVPAAEQVMAAAAGVQNMLLAAHAQGFGAMWKTGACASDPFLVRAIGFQPADVIVGFLYIGTAEKLPPPREIDVTPLVRWL